VLAYCRDLDVGRVASLLANPIDSDKYRLGLYREAFLLTEQLRQMYRRGPYTRRKVIPYKSEEQLLQHADRLTDFLILDLADHFRFYERPDLPQYAGALHKSWVRDSALVMKRMSGHVGASFAEAMCPWVFEQLELAKADSFARVASLAKTAWGSVMPDFVFWRGLGEVPCEAKHYTRQVQWTSGVSTALAQVTAAMTVMDVAEGYIFMAISKDRQGSRYRVEVVHLVR
jgi:hypothetical protein